MRRDKGTSRKKGRWRVKQIRPLSIVLVIIMVVSILCGNILPDTAYADSSDPAQAQEELSAAESEGAGRPEAAAFEAAAEAAEADPSAEGVSTGAAAQDPPAEGASADAAAQNPPAEGAAAGAASQTPAGEAAAVTAAGDAEASAPDAEAGAVQETGAQGGNGAEVPAQEYFEGTLTAESSGYVVTVAVGKGAMIPQGAAVQVTELSAETGGYSDYLAGAENAVAQQNEGIRADTENARLFDLSIVTADGRKIEPNECVSVSISYRNAMTVSDGASMKAVHFGTGGTEVLNASENSYGAGEGEKAVSGVSFETGGFSVYVIIPINPDAGGEAVVRRTYTFKNADGSDYSFTLSRNPDGTDPSGSAVTTNTEILKNGDALIDPGVPSDPLGSGRQFLGWQVTQSSTDAVPVGTMIRFGAVSDIAEDAKADETVTVQAVFDESCRVIYHDEDGNAIRTDLVEEGTVIATDAESDVSYSPYVSTYAFVGWSTAAYSGLDDPARPSVVSGTVTAEKNGEIGLYPVLMSCWWVRFETETGASHIDSQAVPHGGKAAEPSDPTRTGYSFSGWYTADAGGDPYDFDTVVTGDLTLYARWSPKTVNYTVVYLLQNANDDGYAVAKGGIVQKTGLTGEKTSVSPSADDLENASVLSGFHLKGEPDQQMIRPDGSTVVNVYYDRNLYQIDFYENDASNAYTKDPDGEYYYFPGGRVENSFWSTTYDEGYYPNNKGPWANKEGQQKYYTGRYRLVENTAQVTHYRKTDGLIEELTITARYEAEIGHLWPGERTGLSKTYSSIWRVERDSRTFQSNISTMPLGGEDFYSYNPSSNGEHIDYYLEDLNGRYVLDHTDVVGTGMVTTEEDYYPIAGFTCDRARSPEIGTSIGTSGLKFYYTRNSYTITFMNGSDNLGTETFKYQADISGAGSTFAEQMKQLETDDQEFGGWFDNAEGYGEPYDFTGKTMPYSNMILHAHFTPRTHIAEADYNGGESAGPTYIRFERGNGDHYPELGTTRNYIEDPDGDYYYVQIPYTGSGTDASGGYAKYVKKSEITADELMYCDTSVTYSYQEGAYVFVGWYWKGGAKDGQTVDFGEKLTADCRIAAKWRRAGNYYLAYDNDGDGTIDSVGSRAYLDGAAAAVGELQETAPSVNEFVVTGKKTFIGWKMGEEILKPGEIFTIDSAKTESHEGKQVIRLTAAFTSLDSTYIQYQYNAEETEGGTFVLTDIGEGVTDNIQRNLQMNANVTLSSGAGFTRVGYELVGWNDQKDGTGTLYTPGGTYAAYGADGNVLYAIWKRTNKTLTIEKQLSGNMADADETFEFTLSVPADADGAELENLPEGAAKNDDGTYTFHLKGGESIAFTIPYGRTYTVTEKKGTDRAYTTAVSVNGGDALQTMTAEGTITGDTTVVFTNAFNVNVNTGVSRNWVPFVLMMLLSVAAAAGFIRTRRKK